MILGPLDVWRACWRYMRAGLSRNNARTREALIEECLQLRIENAALHAEHEWLTRENKRLVHALVVERARP